MRRQHSAKASTQAQLTLSPSGSVPVSLLSSSLENPALVATCRPRRLRTQPRLLLVSHSRPSLRQSFLSPEQKMPAHVPIVKKRTQKFKRHQSDRCVPLLTRGSSSSALVSRARQEQDLPPLLLPPRRAFVLGTGSLMELSCCLSLGTMVSRSPGASLRVRPPRSGREEEGLVGGSSRSAEEREGDGQQTLRQLWWTALSFSLAGFQGPSSSDVGEERRS